MMVHVSGFLSLGPKETSEQEYSIAVGWSKMPGCRETGTDCEFEVVCSDWVQEVGCALL